MPNVKILTSDEIDYDIKDEKGRLGTAAEFSTSSNYVIGDYCWYDNKLYRFTANHSSSSWTAAHATEVKIANELKTVNSETAELKNELSDSYETYMDIIPMFRATDFTVASGAQTSHDLWKSVHLPVGTYTVSCTQGTTLTTNTRNTFGYKKVGASGYNYESAKTNYNLLSGDRSWIIDIEEEANYQFIMWIHTPSAAVTYSNIRLKSTKTKYDEIDPDALIPISYLYNDFKDGGLNNLDFWDAQPWRVTNYNLHQAPYDLNLVIDSGFRVGWSSGDSNNNFISFSGWKEGYATIPQGTSFRLQIARVTESSSEIANVETFTSAVKTNNYNHYLKLGVDKLIKRNLLGPSASELYPAYIPIGSYISISTSDGSNFSTGEIKCYDINKKFMAAISLFTDRWYRTVYAESGLTGDIYYINLQGEQSVPLQVEIATAPTIYSPYSPSYMTIKQAFTDMFNDGTIGSYNKIEAETTFTANKQIFMVPVKRRGQYVELSFDAKASTSTTLAIRWPSNNGIDIPIINSYYTPYKVRFPFYYSDKLYLSNFTSTAVTAKNIAVKTVDGNVPVDTKGFYIAHRGAFYGKVPENTMMAFSIANQLGYTRFETDVHRTSDGKWVLIHDDSIDRTSNGTGAVSSMTYSQLAAYDYGYYLRDTANGLYNNTPICLLSECLEFSNLTGMRPLLELKSTLTSAYASEIASIISDAGMEDNVDFVSFSFDALGYMAAVMPNAGYYFNGNPTAEHITRLKAIADNVVMSIYGVDNLQNAITACKNADLPFIYSTNSLTDIKTCMENGAIGICTDFVNLAGCYW